MEPAGDGAPGNGQLRVVRISRRVILAEALAGMGAGELVYQVDVAAGGFVAVVQSILPLNCHPGCMDVLRSTGRLSSDAHSARESAAMRLLQDLGRQRRVVINDLHYSWVGRVRREMAAMRRSLRAMAGDPASQEVLLVWRGRRRTLTNLRSVREACEEILAVEAVDGVLTGWVGDLLRAIDIVRDARL